MKKIMMMAAVWVGVCMAALTFSACSSDGDNEPPVSGDLVSGTVPSEEG